MPSPPRAADRPVLTGRHYALLAAGFFALALYGSLVPFHFEAVPLDEALERFRAIPYLTLGIESRSDWVANILLFIPLAFLLTAAASVDRPRRVGWVAAAVVVPFCAALSVAIEFTQIFFPPRTVSLNDIVAESLGGLIGCAVWLVGGQTITGWLRRLWATLGAKGGAARLLPGYLFLLVLVHVMPLDLTISPVEIYHKYKEGRVHLLPFVGVYASPEEAFQKNFLTVLYFLPGGLLLAHLPGPVWGEPRGWKRALAVGLLLAATIEFLQLFVWTRGCDATDVVVGTLAVLAGWGLGVAWRRIPEGRRPVVPRPVWFLVWLGVVLFVNWQPFDFTADWDFVLERWRALSLVPFADMYRGTEYNAFDQVFHKTLLFFPLGVLVAWAGPGTPRLPAEAGVVCAALSVSVAVEFGQLFLPTRYASVSDVLVETFAAWLGFAVTWRWRFGPPVAPPGRG